VQASQSYPQSAQLFWNTGKRRPSLFTSVGPETAGPDLFRPIVGRGSAYADLDGDGDLDVILTANGGPAVLLRNDGGNAHGWLRLDLKGTRSNRDGLGARVEVSVDGKTIRQQHFVARGYLSSVEPTMTFGLGTAREADRVVVRWPSGAVSDLSEVRGSEVILVTEPSTESEAEVNP
jgi:hypothetical protein